MATARTATASTTTAAATTTAIAIATAASIASTIRTSCSRWGRFAFHTIEVWLVIGVEIRAAFDDRGRLSMNDWRHVRSRFWCSAFRVRGRRSAAHLGALLFQDRLARQFD